MIKVSCTIDSSEFDRAFKRYVQVSKRSLADIVNKKAFSVAVQALKHTHHADRSRIAATLGNLVSVSSVNKKGKTTKKRVLQLVQAQKHQAPLAAIIINARRGRAGKEGLEGAKMAKAVRTMVGARLRSIGFLASGWVPAIRKLLNTFKDRSGLPRQDRTVKQVGQPKGGAAPAPPEASWSPSATIWNEVSKREGKTSPIIDHGLQLALNAEAKSMDEYCERKMQENAKAFH